MNQSNNNDNNNNDMDHTNNNTSTTSTTTTAKPPPTTTTMYTYSSNTFNPSTRMGAALNTIHNNHHLATTTVFPGRTSPSPSSSSSSTPLTTSQLLRQQLLQKQNEQLQQQQQQQQQQVADLDSMMGPRRYIFNAPDMTPFRQSEAYASLDRFICQLAHLATGVKLSDIVNKYSHQMSDALKQVMSNLDRMEELAKENPPTAETNSASRYGNLAFRQWFDQMLLESDDLQRKVLKAHLVSTTTTTATTTLDEDVENKETTTTASTSEEACESEENAWKYKELSAYWREGFGNRTRIDYGTGHEVSFCAYMYCLAKLGIARTESDSMCLLGIIFPRYLEVMRYIQLTYKLEPAGSHGVWGLDDYSFLPFLFGSSQLIKNKEGIEPHSIHTPQTLEEYSADYMYLAAIQFIHKVKRGPFSEHSPVLNDISSVPTWTKISSGMIKMYRAEVLDKFVVMQHFLFGKLLPFTPATTPQVSSSQ